MSDYQNKYREIDLATGAEVQQSLRADGFTSYPAICGQCHGSGQCGGETCNNCNGRGSYELAI